MHSIAIQLLTGSLLHVSQPQDFGRSRILQPQLRHMPIADAWKQVFSEPGRSRKGVKLEIKFVSRNRLPNENSLDAFCLRHRLDELLVSQIALADLFRRCFV